MSPTTISQEAFCKAIEALRQQAYEDKKNMQLVAEAFGAEDFSLYDNSKLSTAIIDLLHLFFPRDPDGHSEIEHYCCFLNFGKSSLEEEVVTAEDLYYQLTKNICIQKNS